MKIKEIRKLNLLLILLPLLFISCGKTNTNPKEQKSQSVNLPVFTTANCFGYITAAYSKNNSNYLSIDTVQWLTGKAAVEAYKKDNNLDKVSSTDLPGGYYIRNDSRDSINVELPDSALIIMQTLSHNSSGNYNFNEKITARKFFSLLTQKEFSKFLHKIYIFKIHKNVVVSLREKYIP